MVLTTSTKPQTGATAIDFNLPNTNPGVAVADYSLADVGENNILLLAFICNHCPYVVHIRDALAEFAREYHAKGLRLLAISANDVSSYPQDGPEEMAALSLSSKFIFPYLYDESQQTARDYGAVCTPDFFLYDKDRILVYRGQFDASRPANNIPVSGADLRRAVDAVLSGRAVSGEQIPSVGCSIKWKPGNEPD